MVDRPSRSVPPGSRPPAGQPRDQADRRPEAPPPSPNGTPVNGASGLRRAPDARFWFGDPMPEDDLPPVDRQRPYADQHPPRHNGRHTGAHPLAEPYRNGHSLTGPQQTGGRIPPVRGAPGDRERTGPADHGPPSAFFSPVDPDDPPRWPTLADSPSLRVPPVDPPATRPPAQYVPEPGETSVIPRVPPLPPRITEPDPEPEPDEDEPARADDPEPRSDEDQPKHGKHRKRKKQPLWRELVTLVAVALLLTFLIQHFVGRVYSIPSGSMEQTLHGCPGCTGDRVFVDKMVYDFRDPLPGDVVVFQGPNSWTGEQVNVDGSGDNPFLRGLQYLGSLIGIAPPDERDFVKRVIAIGGQTVECCDEQNRVMVDGKPLDEPYVYWENGGPDERQAFAPVTVPEGTLWVMGDNRGNSADSRIQGGGGIRGVVPITKVIGKVRAIVLPPSRWQGVGDHNPQTLPSVAAPAWQQGLPAGIGIAAAWPVLWIGRRVRKSLSSRKAE